MTRMLERAIEIEGLIRILRDGIPSDETYALLKRKTAELSDEAALLYVQASERREKSEPKNSEMPEMNAYGSSSEDGSPENATVQKAETIQKVADMADATPESVTVQENVTAAKDTACGENMAEKNSYVIADDQQDDIILALDDDDHDEVFIEPEPTATTVTVAPATAPAAAKAESARSAARLKSMFSLNDRFLYARELFGGDMKMFDSTLTFIEGVRDFVDIEDYFYSELEWDPENRFVAMFLETVRPYYNFEC